MKYPKRSQYKYAKSPYRIRDWPEYEDGLQRRGDLTVWLVLSTEADSCPVRRQAEHENDRIPPFPVLLITRFAADST